jgi:arylsulfatase A-like enzyme
MTTPPNILLITTDQHRGDCFGFEGRRVKTPHLDLLATQGTRFSACITPNVVCQPSRASILTGLLPLTHGVHDNGIDLDPAIGEGGFAGRLARAGYATAFFGKAHFATNQPYVPSGGPEDVRSACNYPDDWFGPYMGFEHVELMLLGHNYWLPQKTPKGLHYERWYHADGLGDVKDALYRMRLPPDVGAAQTHHSALPPAWHNTTWTADRTIDFLRSAGPRPFCVWTSFPDPHHPFDAPEPWSRLHSPDDVDLPRHRTRDFDRRPWWHRAALQNAPQGGTPETQRIRREYSRIGPQSDEQLRHLIANYYGMIALVDHNVGRILQALHDGGLAERTLVVFTSDHGEWLGDHGLVLKGPLHYEGLLRVGLIMRGPGVPAGKVVADPVSTIDLAATFADYAGIDAGWAAHSSSLRPLVEGTATRAFAYNEWRLLPARAGVALDLRVVRTRDAKLTLELGSGAGELYDLRNDPDEMHDRFDDPAFAALRSELVAMAMSRPADQRDPLPPQIGPA